jgi:hypothetical protein
MKKTIKYIAAAAVATMLCSCSKFIEEHSQNASYIESADDLEELLYGSGLAATGVTGQYLHLLADESREYYYSATGSAANAADRLLNSAGMFRWLPLPFTDFTGGKASNYLRDEWDGFYEVIAVANSIVENADEFDRTPQVNYIEGSARFLRALNYFRLVNIYGEPYDSRDPDGGMGVPYKSSSKIVQDRMARSTTGFVYDRMVEDLVEAARLLALSDGYARSQYKVSADACNALLSRVYLYMERYGQAIEAADAVDNATLFDMAGGYAPGLGEVFLRLLNPEIIFAQGREGLLSMMPSTGQADSNYQGLFSIVVSSKAYCVADELYALFSADDLRLSAFFARSYQLDLPMARKNRPMLTGSVTETDPLGGAAIQSNIYPAEFSECGVLRAAEVVLNKAEAQACSGDDAGAAATIARFVATRYTTPPAIPAGGDALIEFIRTERRKELCFEGHRWFDLRRYAVNAAHPQTTSITHE